RGAGARARARGGARRHRAPPGGRADGTRRAAVGRSAGARSRGRPGVQRLAPDRRPRLPGREGLERPRRTRAHHRSSPPVIEQAVAALRAGEPVVLPTDTVYGRAADARNEAAVRALYRLKGRAEPQPTAVIAAEIEALVAAVPELGGRPVLAGPYTLILPNPRRRFPWLTGDRPETIGVRVPDL